MDPLCRTEVRGGDPLNHLHGAGSGSGGLVKDSDSYVPADQLMEWNMKASKVVIKHLCSATSDENIYKKYAAMPGVCVMA